MYTLLTTNIRIVTSSSFNLLPFSCTGLGFSLQVSNRLIGIQDILLDGVALEDNGVVSPGR